METISLSPFDYVKPVGENLLQISHNKTFSSTYNLKYCKIKACNGTQEQVINRLLNHNPRTVFDSELNALTSIDLLVKKINTYDNVVTKFLGLTRYSDDKTQIELKRRSIKKHRATLNKYLEALKPDSKFSIERHDKTIHIYYKGQYVTTRRHISSDYFKLGC